MAVDTGTFALPHLARGDEGRACSSPSRGLAGRLTSVAGGAALTILTVLAFALVLIAAQHSTFLTPPALPRAFPGWMAGPLGGLWDGAPSNHSQLMALGSWAMLAMYVSYLVILGCGERVRPRWVLAAILALHVAFLLAPPLSYTDVFNYLNYGRMGVLHHLNPYTTIPALEPHTDPTFVISNWHHLTSPYGPLFTLFSYALVPLGLPLSFWALKVVLGLASLGILALVYRTAELVGRDGARAVAFVGLNPLVLVWGLGGDHNDFLMVFFLMLAVYLIVAARQRPRPEPVGPAWSDIRLGRANLWAWLGEREIAAGAAIATAVAIKASAAVMVPFLLVAAPRRRGVLTGGAVASLLLAAASLLAFGFNLPDLGTQGRLVTDFGLPNLVGLALGQGGETNTVRAAIAAALLLAVLFGALWALRHRRDWIKPATLAILLLVLTLSWTVPWYVLWVLPLAALWRTAYVRIVLLVLGAYFVLAFIPSAGRVFNAIHFKPSQTALGRQHTRDIDQVLR